jgi:hypothetical protein
MDSINTYLVGKDIFSLYSSTELMELALTAYNAGQGTIQKALDYSINHGVSAPKLSDLTSGGNDSAIAHVIPATWGSAKVTEISHYAPQILHRAGYY